MSIRNLMIVFAILSLAVSAYSMNYIFGFGYSPGRSWVMNLGAMNNFNDELGLNIFTPSSTAQSWIYEIKASIPIVGRNDTDKGFRLGPTVDTVVGTSTTFSAGIYGQYYFGPWRFEAAVLKNIMSSNFYFSFGMWYFFSSSQYDFKDYLIANIEINSTLPYISISFIEPF